MGSLRGELWPAGLAGSRGRRGRGAPKSSDPGWVAGRCKKVGLLIWRIGGFTTKTYSVIYPVLGSRFSGFVLICHVGKLPVSPQRNLAFAAFMPTVRWEERKHSPHFFYQSLERFKMVQMLEDLEMFLLFLFSTAIVWSFLLVSTAIVEFSYDLLHCSSNDVFEK